MAEVLVLVEHAEGALKKISAELITAARVLGEPSAVVVGASGTAAALTDGLKEAGAAKIYVAESDRKARETVEPALRYFFTVLHRGFNEAINQAAADQQTLLAQLTSARSFTYFREGNRTRIDFSQLSWDDLVTSGYLIAGNPDTVTRHMQAPMEHIGAGHFMGMFHIGNLSHAHVIHSLNLFT